MRRKGSAHMPPETRARGAPRTLLPEARAAARTRCRRGRPAVRTALMWPPHWEGTPATAWDASCVLKTHSGFSTPCAAEETLNSLKMGNILGRKSRFYLFQKHIDIIKSVDPVKLYEYINFNKNIICLKYEEVERFEPFVYFYNNFEDFKAIINHLKENNSLKYSQTERLDFLQQNTWKERCRFIKNILDEKE